MRPLVIAALALVITGAQPATEPVVPLITPPQLKKLHAMFGESGLTNRDEALAWMSNVLERDITTSKEVTRDEASRLFAELEREPDPTPDHTPETGAQA
jgi:hypothetical protein